MNKIKIYSAEADIADKIQENNTIACYAQAEPYNEPIDKNLLKALKIYAKADEDELDIFYRTKSILVSSVWNKNDDIFSRQGIWAARKTPIHTYCNNGHDHKQIVGCLTDTWALDNEGKIVPDDTKEEDLPDKIHIANSAVIWRYYKEKDMVEQAESLIQEIEDGKKFVSMECLFADFDYGVITPENKYFTVARNEETAFLTKHLRIYGGTGEYQGCKIGRFIKKMVFSGKGYVDKPANPDSVIFDDESQIDFSESGVIDSWLPEIKKSENFIMAGENTDNKVLTDKIKELEAQLAAANTQKFEKDIAGLNDKLTKADETNTSLAEENQTLKTKLAEVEASIKSLNDKIDELTKANEEANKKLAEAAFEKMKSDRVNTLTSGGVDKEVAAQKVEKYAGLSDEQFADIANDIIEAAKSKMDDEMKKKMADKEKKNAECSEAEDEKVLDTAQAKEGEDAGAVESETQESDAEKLRQSLSTTLENYLS